MSKTIDELIRFDSEQHNRDCGVTITHDLGNCDCNKSEFKQALLQALMEVKPEEKYVNPDSTEPDFYANSEGYNQALDQYSNAIKELFGDKNE